MRIILVILLILVQIQVIFNYQKNIMYQSLQFLVDDNDQNIVLNEDQKAIKNEIRKLKSKINSKIFFKFYGLQRSQRMSLYSEQDRKSILCEQCEKFVKYLDLFATSNYIQNILDKIFQYIFCIGLDTEYGKILIKNLIKKFFNPQSVCTNYKLCRGKEYDVLSVKSFAKRVLEDQPSRKIIEPTKKSSYKILHLTDIHIDVDYAEGFSNDCDEPFCCRIENGKAKNEKNNAGKWGSVAKCDIPIKTLEQAIKFAGEKLKPDLIIWTGDSQNHDVWNHNKQNQTKPQQIVTNLIKKYMNNTQVYAIFGNHECYPTDIFDFHSNNSMYLKQESADMWQQYLNEESRQSMLRQGYYSQYDKNHNVKFIAMNTQACDNINFFLFSNVTDPGNQLQWLEDQLRETEEKNGTVIIFGHIPMGDYFCSSQWSNRYNILIERYQNIIRGQIYGHTHFDHISIQKSYVDKVTPVGTIFISPSLTTFDYKNPSMRLYELDKDTNVILDYHQYRLDLVKANQQQHDELNFDLAYSMKQHYNLQNLQIEQMDELVKSLEDNVDLLKQYVYNYHSGGPLKDKDIEGIYQTSIQRYYVCQAKYSNFDDFYDCMGIYNLKYSTNLLFRVLEYIQGQWFKINQKI